MLVRRRGGKQLGQDDEHAHVRGVRRRVAARRGFSLGYAAGVVGSAASDPLSRPAVAARIVSFISSPATLNVAGTSLAQTGPIHTSPL